MKLSTAEELLLLFTFILGAIGSIVVEALYCKPDSIPDEVNEFFQFT
jgi:hypothetical protein